MGKYGVAVTMQDVAAATGNGTALTTPADAQHVAMQLSGTFTATVTFEATVDGSNWIAVACEDLNSTTRARSTTATAAGIFLLDDAGAVNQVRARVSAYTSGSVTVKARAG